MERIFSWKRIFRINSHVRLLVGYSVGWSIGRSVTQQNSLLGLFIVLTYTLAPFRWPWLTLSGAHTFFLAPVRWHLLNHYRLSCLPPSAFHFTYPLAPFHRPSLTSWRLLAILALPPGAFLLSSWRPFAGPSSLPHCACLLALTYPIAEIC